MTAQTQSKPQIEIQAVYVDPDPQTTVLWVSRHKPLAKQIMDLKAKLGRIKVIQVSGPVPNAEYVIELARKFDAKIIVPVLPMSFIARLAELAPKHGITVLYAKMNVVAQVNSIEEAAKIVAEAPDRRTLTTYADGTVKVHEFERFEKVIKVFILTEPW